MGFETVKRRCSCIDILQMGALAFRAAMAVLDAFAAGHSCNIRASPFLSVRVFYVLGSSFSRGCSL